MSEPPRAPPNQEYEWTLNATVWDAVNEFAAAVGFEIVFGINAGAGPRTPSTGSISSSNSLSGDAGPWTADNALEMIKYNQEHGFPVVGYEFGYEPDLFSSALNISGESASASSAPCGEACLATKLTPHLVVDMVHACVLAHGQQLHQASMPRTLPCLHKQSRAWMRH